MRKYHEFQEVGESVELKITTLCPQKYLLIDRQTGVVYEGNNLGSWDRLDPVKRFTRKFHGIG